MRPTPAEAERELLLTLAKAFRSYVSDPTRRADDHLYLEALDAAIKRVEASEVVKPAALPGARPDGGMAYQDDTNRPACRFVGDAAS